MQDVCVKMLQSSLLTETKCTNAIISEHQALPGKDEFASTYYTGEHCNVWRP